MTINLNIISPKEIIEAGGINQYIKKKNIKKNDGSQFLSIKLTTKEEEKLDKILKKD